MIGMSRQDEKDDAGANTNGDKPQQSKSSVIPDSWDLTDRQRAFIDSFSEEENEHNNKKP